MRINEIRGSNSKKLKKMARDVVFYDGFSFFSASSAYFMYIVYNYFSENARIKFIPIDADVSGVVMD